jgi:hypothetical protein
VYDVMAYLTREERERYAAIEDDYEKSRLVDEAIRERVVAGRLTDLASLPFYIPARTKSIVRKATARDPDARYQSASDMVSAVHAAWNLSLNWDYEDGQPVARTRRGLYRLWRSEMGGQYLVQQNRGSGWRRVPGTGSGSLSGQLRILEARARA